MRHLDRVRRSAQRAAEQIVACRDDEDASRRIALANLVAKRDPTWAEAFTKRYEELLGAR